MLPGTFMYVYLGRAGVEERARRSGLEPPMDHVDRGSCGDSGAYPLSDATGWQSAVTPPLSRLYHNLSRARMALGWL